VVVDVSDRLVEFRSEDDSSGTVVGVAFRRDTSGSGLDLFTVHVSAPGVSCDHAALSFGGDGLATFMAHLARDWRGWTGTRRWDALENGMGIEATHHGGRVELLFIVRRDLERDAWELRVPISLAPGESLARVALACAGLFADSP
jgi:Family of unknown function (DUF6228)